MRHKAWDVFRQVGGEQLCVLKTQAVVYGAVENHVGFVLYGGGGTLQASAHVAGGPDGLRQVAFAFNAKVMATSSKTAERDAVFDVCDFMQVGDRVGKGHIATDAM